MDILWSVLSKVADIIGVVSLFISLITMNNTRKLRTSMIARAETSEYRMAIDEQVGELEVFKALLVDGNGLDANVFLELMNVLRNIRIAYETILPGKLLKKIDYVTSYTKKNLFVKSGPYTKEQLDPCISSIVYVIAELKKEKKIL